MKRITVLKREGNVQQAFKIAGNRSREPQDHPSYSSFDQILEDANGEPGNQIRFIEAECRNNNSTRIAALGTGEEQDNDSIVCSWSSLDSSDEGDSMPQKGKSTSATELGIEEYQISALELSGRPGKKKRVVEELLKETGSMLEEDEEALTSMGGDSMEVVAAASAPETLEVDMSEEVATTADHQEIDGDTSPERVELQRLRQYRRTNEQYRRVIPFRKQKRRRGNVIGGKKV